MNNFLYLVWYEEENKVLNLIAKLTYENNIYKFEYLNYETSDLQLFSNNGLFYGFDDINEIYTGYDLFPTIKNRLPSKKREDYLKILKNYGLDESAGDFEVLLKSNGRLSTDKFLFITELEYEKLKKKIVC